MNIRNTFLPAALFVAVLLPAAPALADGGGTAASHPSLQPRALDLLPLSDLERAAFNKEHGVLVYRTQALHKKVNSLDGQIRRLTAGRAKAKDKKKVTAEIQKAQKERKRIALQVSALMARLTDELVADGMEPALIPVMNAAPAGRGRLDRHSRSLVLMIPTLSEAQWSLFQRVVTQLDGATHAIAAQKDRTLLALKQTELDKPEVRGVASTFDRQLRVIDQRFWQLVDFTLDEDQRAALWKMLPQRIRRKSQAVEHLYTLDDLSPAQATRLKALMTEIEHESSPDNAAIKRINAELKKKDLDGSERKALNKERGEAYGRLTALRQFATDTTKEILTEAQWHEYLAIPPRLSTNDRRANNSRILQGFKPSAAQSEKMKEIGADARKRRRASQKRVAQIRRDGGDYGPDSPQMMTMQMEMAGVQADGARMQREMFGRYFLEVLTPDDVTRWVMGHYGYKR